MLQLMFCTVMAACPGVSFADARKGREGWDERWNGMAFPSSWLLGRVHPIPSHCYLQLPFRAIGYESPLPSSSSSSCETILLNFRLSKDIVLFSVKTSANSRPRLASGHTQAAAL